MHRRSFYALSNVKTKERLMEFRSQTNTEYRCRIVVLDAPKVGKSAIVQQFLYNHFPEKHRKTAEDEYTAKYISESGDRLTMEVVDTAGSYNISASRPQTLQNGDAFILVYSLDNHNSWERIKDLRNKIFSARDSDVPIFIVADKHDENGSDLEETYEKTTLQWNCDHIECSAKNRINIARIFEKVLAKLNIRFDLNEAVRRRSVYPSHSEKL